MIRGSWVMISLDLQFACHEQSPRNYSDHYYESRLLPIDQGILIPAPNIKQRLPLNGAFSPPNGSTNPWSRFPAAFRVEPTTHMEGGQRWLGGNPFLVQLFINMEVESRIFWSSSRAKVCRTDISSWQLRCWWFSSTYYWMSPLHQIIDLDLRCLERRSVETNPRTSERSILDS